jgi:hypothetical protein
MFLLNWIFNECQRPLTWRSDKLRNFGFCTKMLLLGNEIPDNALII